MFLHLCKCNDGFCACSYICDVDILSAISQRNVEQLRKAIKLVEIKRYVERLKKELKEAKNTLASLERIQR